MTELNWNPDRFRCSRCKAELVPSNADVGGSAGDVEITLRHLPCLVCPEDHEKAATSPDFGEALLDAVFGAGGIPVVKRKGMLKKTSLCPRCGSELAGPTASATFNLAVRLHQPARRHDVEFEILEASAGDDPSIFFMDVRGPAVTCGSCGTRSSASGAGVTSPIRDALIDAFESNLSGGR